MIPTLLPVLQVELLGCEMVSMPFQSGGVVNCEDKNCFNLSYIGFCNYESGRIRKLYNTSIIAIHASAHPKASRRQLYRRLDREDFGHTTR